MPQTGGAPLTATYVRVLVIEGLVVGALWILGRVYS